MKYELATRFAREVQRDTAWVMRSYGSDAGERKEPGSKARSQALRIAAFADQYTMAQEEIKESELFRELDLVQVLVVGTSPIPCYTAPAAMQAALQAVKRLSDRPEGPESWHCPTEANGPTLGELVDGALKLAEEQLGGERKE